MFEHTTDPNLYYTNCSITELRDILSIDLLNDTSDSLSIENIHQICSVLAEKSTSCKFDPSKSWISFKEQYLPLAEQKESLYTENYQNLHFKKNFRISKAAAICVICIAACITTYTAVAERIQLQTAAWTPDVFWFTDRYSSSYDHLSIVDLTDEFDVPIPYNLLPTWMPEGFDEPQVEGYEIEQYKFRSYFFENTKTSDFMSVNVFYLYEDTQVTYEKDEGPTSIIEKDGISYYIMSNLDTNTVIWRNGSFECQIDGTITQETIYEMIASIPTK